MPMDPQRRWGQDLRGPVLAAGALVAVAQQLRKVRVARRFRDEDCWDYRSNLGQGKIIGIAMPLVTSSY